jgi:hypothetical protein
MGIIDLDQSPTVREVLAAGSVYQDEQKLYYFVNQTLPDYRPMIYGAASRPLIWVVRDYLKERFFDKLFSRSQSLN